MENSSMPLYQQDNMYQTCATLHQYNYPSSEGYSSLSPASSIDSIGLSPPYIGYATSQEAYGNISMPCSQQMDVKIQPNIPSEKKTKKMKGKLPYSQRQSASEREKMRMRNISKALQNLRRYLPPSVAPIDKTLTKIETLQLTISYISLLSEQLGLSEEVLEQRRQAAIQTRCAQDVSCCMDMSHSLCSESVKQNPPIGPPTEHIPLTRTPAIDSRWLNMQTSCQMPYEMPQYHALPVSPLQNHYQEPGTTLSQPANDYYVTSHQQMTF
ncbi:mesoderm posterior protein 1-like [Bufo bufo]|uniref:mesoderm posterior protein 1-like n=1 Tax=Bufo bufo TaxID=8384 RepID=UPI001ABE6F5A|nr:mesoderm posterior protein 1-like [Bufo bufo]